jgi:NAD(P)H-binding
VQERIVRNSKLNWVIVRPVILTDGPKTNTYRALIDARDWTCGFISRADVADFVVNEIDDNAFSKDFSASATASRCARAEARAASVLGGALTSTELARPATACPTCRAAPSHQASGLPLATAASFGGW